ncbi:hypothetical protein D3C86_1455230 [compost metagenome]
MRIGHAVEHQQQRCAFGAVEQLIEHRLAPDLARTHFRHHALMHAFNPCIQLTTLGIAHGNAIFRSQLDQRLNPRIAAAFSQPDLLDAFRVVTQQRFYRMHAVDLFQLTHDLALGLRTPPLLAAGAEPALGGPLRCLLGLAGLPPGAWSGADRPVFPPDAALPPLFASDSNACFSSRLLRNSAFFAAASLGR